MHAPLAERRLMAVLGPVANAPSVRYDFFLAHAGADKTEATSLYHLLSNTRHQVFFDAETLLPGALWDIEIPRAQRQSDVTVVLISSKSEAAYYEREEIAAAIGGGHPRIANFHAAFSYDFQL